MQVDTITSKQEKYLNYLVCKAVDYGRRMYIMVSAGQVVPVLIPKGYDFRVTLHDVSKADARLLIKQLIHAKDNANDLSRVDRVLADKIQLNETELTLADFIFGKRVVL